MTISNPMLDVRRDLTRGEDIPLLSFTTDDPAPAYLRISVLDEFNGAAWIPSDRDIPPENRADGALPPAPGLSPATKRTEYTWSISVTDDFRSTWLPVPYPATNLQVQGDWRYDERTLDFFTPTEDLTTRGLDYEVVGAVVHATNTALVSAPPANRTVFVNQTALPASVPSWLEDLARDITDGARSNFERAVMLQQWFREDGGFEYSTASGEGNGTEQLALFLGTGPDSRTGYCEQFAAAMTLLARSLGIPARIAVGFLRPERQGDTWVYSAHDMHAWPEIYFEGTGWVRFEPTPETEAGAVEVPAYTTGRVPAPDDLALPSASTSAQNPDELPTPTDRSGDSSSADAAGPGVGRWAGLAAIGVLVLGVLALPRAVRAWLRRRRLSGDHPGGAAEGGWAEVRATALDLGLGWDDGVTLRRRARSLSPILAPAGHGDRPARRRRPDTGGGVGAAGPPRRAVPLLADRSAAGGRGGGAGPGGHRHRRDAARCQAARPAPGDVATGVAVAQWVQRATAAQHVVGRPVGRAGPGLALALLHRSRAQKPPFWSRRRRQRSSKRSIIVPCFGAFGCLPLLLLLLLPPWTTRSPCSEESPRASAWKAARFWPRQEVSVK